MTGWAWPRELLEGGELLFSEPVWLWALLLAPLLVLALPRARGGDRARNLASLLLRIVACWALVLAAARPFSIQREPDLSIVVALDASASMSVDRIADLRSVAEGYIDLVPDSVDLRWVALGDELAFDGELPPRSPERGTDLAALIDLALAAAPPARSRRVLLLSDGADTRGQGEISAALGSATLAGASGATIYPIPSRAVSLRRCSPVCARR